MDVRVPPSISFDEPLHRRATWTIETDMKWSCDFGEPLGSLWGAFGGKMLWPSKRLWRSMLKYCWWLKEWSGPWLWCHWSTSTCNGTQGFWLDGVFFFLINNIVSFSFNWYEDPWIYFTQRMAVGKCTRDATPLQDEEKKVTDAWQLGGRLEVVGGHQICKIACLLYCSTHGPYP